MRTGPGLHCTPDCQVIERWMGATLYSRRIIHHHGDDPAWGSYNAIVLGTGCAHADDQTCLGRREARVA